MQQTTTRNMIKPTLKRIGRGRYLCGSKSTLGVVYTVQLGANGHHTCDCSARTVMCFHVARALELSAYLAEGHGQAAPAVTTRHAGRARYRNASASMFTGAGVRTVGARDREEGVQCLTNHRHLLFAPTGTHSAP